MHSDTLHTASHPVVPAKDDTPAKDFSEKCSYPTVDEAEDAFVAAKERLLHPDRWHRLAGAMSAEFELCNGRGEPQGRAVRAGDLLRIQVPGPSGMADDWVRVEALTYDDYPDDQREELALRVRPTTAPGSSSDATAHFFNEESTSSFVIARSGNILTAAYHGRHEVPNSSGDSLLRKARNVVTALGGLLGFSNLQWKALLRGLLNQKACPDGK